MAPSGLAMRSSNAVGWCLTWKDSVMAMETMAMVTESRRYDKKAAHGSVSWPFTCAQSRDGRGARLTYYAHLHSDLGRRCSRSRRAAVRGAAMRRRRMTLRGLCCVTRVREGHV